MAPIKNLVFDLDGTLYPLSSGLGEDCQCRVYDFFCQKLKISVDEAKKISEKLLQKYHYESQGVEKELGISEEEFMEYICRTSVNSLQKNQKLEELLLKLAQRKFIFTDSTVRHSLDVLEKIGVRADIFDQIYDAKQGGYIYKLEAKAFNRFCDFCKIHPEESIIFEDSCKSLSFAKEVGFTTVLIAEEGQNCKAADYVFPNIDQALEYLHKQGI